MSARFMVFGGEFAAEPLGGMRDLIADYGTAAEAIAFADGYVKGQGCTSWARVNNAATGEEIAERKGR